MTNERAAAAPFLTETLWRFDIPHSVRKVVSILLAVDDGARRVREAVAGMTGEFAPTS